MRVALVSPLFESVPPKFYGGTERVIFNLCRGLTEAGVEVTLFASGDSEAPATLIPVIHEALRLRRKPVYDPQAYNFKLLAEVADRAAQFDVIHNHHDYWMLPLNRMTRTPVLTTLHGRLDLPDIGEAFSSYPHAPFVSISHAQRQPMPDLRWIQTIYHGLELSEFTFYPRAGKYLAFLGRISVDKRPAWAIEIAKKSGVPLKIAAKIEGKASQEYFDAYVKPHLGKDIEFIGEISDREKCQFLGEAMGLVFPIDWPEPFGLVMIESLACGTPVLARPCGSAPEILREGVTGFSHPDISELARRVRDLPSLDRQGCRRWVEEHFSLQRMTEDYIHVYRQLLEFSSGQSRSAKRRKSYRDRRNFLHPVQRTINGDS